ncbi:MAG: hypothetical protein ABSD28_11330 [Tepidisphaeraceae bacterium]|jgi:hypothetical protein
MSIREAINQKKSVGVGVAILILVLAVLILVYSQMPAHRIKGDKAYFTDDDGQTWFLDSTYLTPPFDHNGKPAVSAALYSYDHGNKKFCPFLMRYTDSAKKRLDDAIAEAAKQGKPPSSVSLFGDLELNKTGVEVKIPGPGHAWVLRDTTEGADTINQGLATHADDTSDLVIPE